MPNIRVTNQSAADTTWPAAAELTVAASVASNIGHEIPKWDRVGGVAVSASAQEGGADRLRVEIAGPDVATRAGIEGVVFSVTRLDGPSASLRFDLSYKSFANAAGGQYGYRLRLVELPACVLTSPQVQACRTAKPIGYTNNRVDEELETTLAAARNGSKVVLAATSGVSSPNGTYAKTSLAPSGSWKVTRGTGGFDWSYPIVVPPAAAGSDVSPQIAISYSSASVDGRTSATNDQASWIGEGWDYSPGYVERSYEPCADLGESTSGDLCWAGQQLTLSTSSGTEPIVEASNGTYHLGSDDASQVQLVYPNGNSGHGYQGEYWEITNPAGVHYFYGLDNLPGGTTSTNSTWTVPVFSTQSGQPCYNANFATAECMQAYRWNLDFVVDPDDNAAAYYYTQEYNYYSPASSPSSLLLYTRDGYLNEIVYGIRDESSGADPANPLAGSITAVQSSDRVQFTVAERCFPTSTFACQPSQFNATNGSNWEDVPQDEDCTVPGSTTTPPQAAPSCNNDSPTFWTRQRLSAITTQFYNAGASTPGWQTVDQYSLGQSFNLNGDYELQLNTMTRTAYPTTGSNSIKLSPVRFSYQLMDNRVAGWNSTSGEPNMEHNRLTQIITDTGSDITIWYSCSSSEEAQPSNCTSEEIPPQPGPSPAAAPVCIAANLPTSSPPADDPLSCYSVYWDNNGAFTLDWFQSYVVTEVQVSDPTLGDPTQITAYNYLSNPYWHYDDDPTVPAGGRGWSQWRGYASVQTRTGNSNNVSNGAADQWTLSADTYYLGMRDDGPSGSDNPDFTVSDSMGATHADLNQYAGLLLEHQTFNYDQSPEQELSATITTPETVATTASQIETGLPALTASIVEDAASTAYTDLSAGGYSDTKTAYTYNSANGLVETETDTGSGGITPLCTTTSYATNTVSPVYIIDKVAETVRYANTCSTGTVLSDVRTYYDQLPLGQVGHTANTTESDTETTSSPVHFARTTFAGDLEGRTTSTTTYLSASDTVGRTTTTTHTPADGGPLTATSTTSPPDAQGTQLVTTTSVDPGRGVTTSSTNAAGQVTTTVYDALGRVSAVWDPGQTLALRPTKTYSYQYGPGAPLAVTVNSLTDCGGNCGVDVPGSAEFAYTTTVEIYDSLGQLRQTQTSALACSGSFSVGCDTLSGSVVADTYYDSHGWVIATNNHYNISANPSTTVRYPAALCDIYDRTQNSYDGAGRVTTSSEYNENANNCQGSLPGPTWSTETIYSGNATTTIPPTGGVETTDTYDARGNTTSLQQWTSPPTISDGVISGGAADITAYSYDALNRKTQMTTASGTAQAATWRWTYDQAGRVIDQADPDTGLMQSSYDDAGELISTTDAKHQTLAYAYDGLGRKIAEYNGSLSGTELASWTYDTLQAGQLTSESRYATGGAFPGTYTVAATGYDSNGNQTGTTTTIPADVPGLNKSYTTSETWTSTNLLDTETPAAGGNLPIETLQYYYDPFGQVDGLDGDYTPDSEIVYTPYGQPAQYVLGVNNQASALNYTYNPETFSVTDTSFDVQAAYPQVENTSYTYNAAGYITQSVDTQGDPNNNAPVETDCYTYDGVDELTAAWSSATTGSCATNPSTAGNSAVGGPEPYWQTYNYDPAGDRQTVDDHATSGSSSNDTVTTYTTDTTGHAHALTSTSTTGPNATTASYTYDADGNVQTSTVPAGQTTYKWSTTDNLTSLTAPNGTTAYNYDADGNVILQEDTTSAGSTITLYLPGEQLTYANGGTTGRRYYSVNGI